MSIIKQNIITIRNHYRKHGEKMGLNTCNMILSKIQTFEKSGKAEIEADDLAIISILQQYKKQVNEELDFAVKQKFADRQQNLEEEIKIIDFFLPKPLSDEELSTLIAQARLELTDANKGKIIGRVKQLSEGKADGKRIADMVNKIII